MLGYEKNSLIEYQRMNSKQLQSSTRIRRWSTICNWRMMNRSDQSIRITNRKKRRFKRRFTFNSTNMIHCKVCKSNVKSPSISCCWTFNKCTIFNKIKQMTTHLFKKNGCAITWICDWIKITINNIWITWKWDCTFVCEVWENFPIEKVYVFIRGRCYFTIKFWPWWMKSKFWSEFDFDEKKTSSYFKRGKEVLQPKLVGQSQFFNWYI